MGLDVYVGSFTRYYLHDWETVIQRHGRENGMRVQIVRPGGGNDEPKVTNPDEVRENILAWRAGLNEALTGAIESPLDWDESAASPYFTDKPAWDCYGSLQLWAAYAEHPDLPRPVETNEDWAEDPAHQRSSNIEFDSAYKQLVRGCEIWLPADFTFTFRAQDPGGNEMEFGSSIALLAQLENLNAKTWRADEAELTRARRENADHLAPMEIGAKFAFAIMYQLAQDAVKHKLIMKLDY